MTTYSEKLRDPRWQRKRLERLQEANWMCESCKADDLPLHVHHLIYRRGVDPWDYANHELAVLCESCHADAHDKPKRVRSLDVQIDPEIKTYRYPWERLDGRFAMRMHELTLWTGHSKHGKTTALNQAVLSAIAQGARAGIVSFEYPPADLVRTLRWQSMGIKHGPMTALQIDEFREWIDQKLYLYDHHGMQDAVKIAAVVWHMAKALQLEVIVVDSLMMCGVQTDGDGFASAQTEFVNRLLNVVREFPCHVHLVAHARKDRDDSRMPGLLDVSGHANLVNLPHNVVSLWRNKSEGRKEDAVLSVLGDRRNGFDGKLRMWWHETARQYLDDVTLDPVSYCR